MNGQVAIELLNEIRDAKLFVVSHTDHGDIGNSSASTDCHTRMRM